MKEAFKTINFSSERTALISKCNEIVVLKKIADAGGWKGE